MATTAANDSDRGRPDDYRRTCPDCGTERDLRKFLVFVAFDCPGCGDAFVVGKSDVPTETWAEAEPSDRVPPVE